MVLSAKLLSYYGSDRSIAERAWVSTNKAQNRNDEDVERVLKFLIYNKHTKPLETVVFSFSIDCDIATDRQICTHRMTTASIALSHRYTMAEPKFYIPPLTGDAALMYNDTVQNCFDNYKAVFRELLLEGYPEKRAKEIARNLLPMCTFTKRELDINLLSLANFLKLRLDKHAQLEVQQIAHMMYGEVMAIPQLSTITKLLDGIGWTL